jgi:hypothetical protein
MLERSLKFHAVVIVAAVAFLLGIAAAEGPWHHHDDASGRPCHTCLIGHLPALRVNASPVAHPLLIVARHTLSQVCFLGLDATRL